MNTTQITKSEAALQAAWHALVLQEVFELYLRVIDPSQYLYDWVRLNVTTPASYALTHNALFGSIDVMSFLNGIVPDDSPQYVSECHRFRVELFKELTTHGQATTIHEELKQTRSSLELPFLKGGGFNFGDLPVFTASYANALAQPAAIILAERAKLDLCPMTNLLADVYARYLLAAPSVLTKDPSEADLLAHLQFLKDLFVKYYLVNGYRQVHGLHSIISQAIVDFLKEYHYLTALFDTELCPDPEAEREFQFLSDQAIKSIYRV